MTDYISTDPNFGEAIPAGSPYLSTDANFGTETRLGGSAAAIGRVRRRACGIRRGKPFTPRYSVTLKRGPRVRPRAYRKSQPRRTCSSMRPRLAV